MSDIPHLVNDAATFQDVVRTVNQIIDRVNALPLPAEPDTENDPWLWLEDPAAES